MSNHTIPFHFTESDSTKAFSAFDGLLRKGVDGARCPDLEFIVDHMSETLVEDAAEVDVGVEFGAEDPGVHGFVAVVVEACFDELFAKVVCSQVVFRESNSVRKKWEGEGVGT